MKPRLSLVGAQHRCAPVRQEQIVRAIFLALRFYVAALYAAIHFAFGVTDATMPLPSRMVRI
jgi:hypothetical protein